MANINLGIPDEKLQEVIDATIHKFRIPQIDNPAFVTVEATPNEEPRINEFTDTQWVKEAWRRDIVKSVKEHKTYKAIKAIDIQSDDTMVS